MLPSSSSYHHPVTTAAAGGAGLAQHANNTATLHGHPNSGHSSGSEVPPALFVHAATIGKSPYLRHSAATLSAADKDEMTTFKLSMAAQAGNIGSPASNRLPLNTGGFTMHPMSGGNSNGTGGYNSNNGIMGSDLSGSEADKDDRYDSSSTASESNATQIWVPPPNLGTPSTPHRALPPGRLLEAVAQQQEPRISTNPYHPVSQTQHQFPISQQPLTAAAAALGQPLDSSYHSLISRQPSQQVSLYNDEVNGQAVHLHQLAGAIPMELYHHSPSGSGPHQTVSNNSYMSPDETDSNQSANGVPVGVGAPLLHAAAPAAHMEQHESMKSSPQVPDSGYSGQSNESQISPTNTLMSSGSRDPGSSVCGGLTSTPYPGARSQCSFRSPQPPLGTNMTLGGPRGGPPGARQLFVGGNTLALAAGAHGHCAPGQLSPIWEQCDYKSSLFSSLSCLYGLCVIVLGVVLPISECFTLKNSTKIFFQGFYIYLYSVSIIFLAYVYLYLLRRRSQKRKKWSVNAALSQRNRQMQRPPQQRFLVAGMLGGNGGVPQQRTCEEYDATSPSSSDGCDSTSSSGNPKGPMAGSFYLRVGAVIFGVGSMTQDGLRFSQFFEQDLFGPCADFVTGACTLLRLLFTFFQLYFIFLNSKMCTKNLRAITFFGLMHMIACNLCNWMDGVVKQAWHDISFHKPSTPIDSDHDGFHLHVEDHTNWTLANYKALYGQNVTIHCENIDILGEVVEKVSPYLYQFTGQYSLIAAGILYRMWLNMAEARQFYYHHAKKTDNLSRVNNSGSSSHNHKANCKGATKGFFTGILVLVAAMISVIVFFVLLKRENFVYAALLLINVSLISILCLALIATIMGSIGIQQLPFESHKRNSLDSILLFVSLLGVFAYLIFSLVAAVHKLTTKGGTILFVTSAVYLFEVIGQTLLILNGQKRVTNPKNRRDVQSKPGREYVTFLAVINLALYVFVIIENHITHSNPVQQNFFGYLIWTIVTHFCLPLVAFYRFHSAVCLANIWKEAYQTNVYRL